MNFYELNVYYQGGKIMELEGLQFKDTKVVFSRIRDYLAGNATGITRDEKLVAQLIDVLFCKFYDEKYNENIFFSPKSKNSKKELNDFFDLVKTKFKGVFEKNERIELDKNSIDFIFSELSGFSLLESSRDPIGDAFEVFISTSIRGGEGQFFTPKNVVEMIVDIIAPTPEERIIDPACGSGGFLSVALKRIKETYNVKNIARDNIRGIDKDNFLAAISKAYIALMDDSQTSIFSENSLDNIINWSEETRKHIALESFDIVITNPPFGSKIPIKDKSILSQYSLGKVWLRTDDDLVETSKLLDFQPPQILFIERCYQLLKPNGRMAIVLPDGILGNVTDTYVRKFILDKFELMGIVDCPPETFQPSTSTKTSVLFLKKKGLKSNSQNKVFFSKVNKSGHDKRGKEIELDEFPMVAKKISQMYQGEKQERLAFQIDINLIKNSQDLVFSYNYYNPEISKELTILKQKGYKLYSIRELIDLDILDLRRGNEVGSKNYGSGNYPFIRTSDISNLEIRINKETLVPKSVYEKYKINQDVRVNDILFVNDGGRMVGETSIVTENLTEIVFQSHIKKIRVNSNNINLNPFYLIYLLNLPIVKKQVASKLFTQATIPSMGSRLVEIFLPIDNDKDKIESITKKLEIIIKNRSILMKELLDLIGF
jgi:type I restriction enzyme M protein